MIHGGGGIFWPGVYDQFLTKVFIQKIVYWTSKQQLPPLPHFNEIIFQISKLYNSGIPIRDNNRSLHNTFFPWLWKMLMYEDKIIKITIYLPNTNLIMSLASHTFRNLGMPMLEVCVKATPDGQPSTLTLTWPLLIAPYSTDFFLLFVASAAFILKQR